MKTIKIKWGSEAFDDLMKRYKDILFNFVGLCTPTGLSINVRYEVKAKRITAFGNLKAYAVLEREMDLPNLIANLDFPLTDYAAGITYHFGE